MPDLGAVVKRAIVHAFVAGASAAAAQAQNAPAIPTAPQPAARQQADLKKLVTDLGSADIQARIAAQAQLSEQKSITLKQIESVLRDQPLTPEQRKRLLSTAHQRFLAEPRAAMGIQFDFNAPGIHGVGLARVLPGFPASEVLKQGDRIISAAGFSIETQEQDTLDAQDMLRAVIISRDPGDEIPITLVRDGVTINLKIKLGSYKDLGNANNANNPPLDALRLAKPWDIRSRDLGDPEAHKAKPIESGLASAAWDRNADADIDETDAARMAEAAGLDRTGIVAGGEPRGGVPSPPNTPVAGRFDPGNRAVPGPRDAGLFQAQLEVRRAFLARIQNDRAEAEQQLRDPNLTAAQRQIIKSRLESYAMQSQAISEDIRALELQLSRPQQRILPR